MTSMYCFFLNDTATTEIYALSLHAALPISLAVLAEHEPERDVHRLDLVGQPARPARDREHHRHVLGLAVVDDVDRKSTRLNSSHANISYAVFCLKKKKLNMNIYPQTVAHQY